ncbi:MULTISPECIES: hypothetical protein [Enterobacteriaceae]|nr:hypothetical protein [Klebsiella pneumoniae]MED6004879.1 hypothetical protein [Klebsiella pneumoniae]MED6058307.1 hypothetical protein [Klebsiella pneumoniae]
MIVRALDSSHDWTFGNNSTDYLQKSAAIKQCVITAVLSVRNDWFLALEHGVNWMDYLGRSTNMDMLEDDLKSAILAVDGVYLITNMSIDLDRQKRHATISIQYTDIFNNKMAVSVNVDNR